MPFNLDTFQNHLTTANASYSSRKESSLAPLERHLSYFKVAQPAQIQELWGVVPHAKQVKYINAGNYLKTLVPGLVDATPCKPIMKFNEFHIGKTTFKGDSNYIARYSHFHSLSYSSSNGSLNSLSTVGTRESIVHRNAPNSAPFHPTVCGGILANFTAGANTNTGGQIGECTDEHSIGNPQLILRRPIAPGSIIADQVYQYTADGTTWHNIPGATYEIEKGVRMSSGNLVFYFRKQSTNDLLSRRLANRFHFEVEYAIGPAIPNSLTGIPRPPTTIASLSDYTSRVVANVQ